MLKVIKRVLRLSGDLSKRIYASFVFSFIQNPYCFRIGDVVIKVVYKENGPSFQQNMIDMLQTV